MSAMANRTVLVDNNTWNNTHIATVGETLILRAPTPTCHLFSLILQSDDSSIPVLTLFIPSEYLTARSLGRFYSTLSPHPILSYSTFPCRPCPRHY